jgi:hypothetical protein
VLEHLHPVTALRRRERGGEAADAAAGHDDFHRAHSHQRD